METALKSCEMLTFLSRALACTVPVSFECLHGLSLGDPQEDELLPQAFCLPPVDPAHFAGGWHMHTST